MGAFPCHSEILCGAAAIPELALPITTVDDRAKSKRRLIGCPSAVDGFMFGRPSYSMSDRVPNPSRIPWITKKNSVDQ
jgi:hypothetical protein